MTKNSSSNRAVVPEAKGALDRFKFEVANELGVPLTDGYNGNLTSKQNGSVDRCPAILRMNSTDSFPRTDLSEI